MALRKRKLDYCLMWLFSSISDKPFLLIYIKIALYMCDITLVVLGIDLRIQLSWIDEKFHLVKVFDILTNYSRQITNICKYSYIPNQISQQSINKHLNSSSLVFLLFPAPPIVACAFFLRRSTEVLSEDIYFKNETGSYNPLVQHKGRAEFG